MVNVELFAKIARDYTIKQLPTITVFYDACYRLPKVSTLSFTRQIVVPVDENVQQPYPVEAGGATPNAPEADVIDVNFNLRTFERSFTEKNLHLESIEFENYLKEMVDATNKNIARVIDLYILGKIKERATDVAASTPWYDTTTNTADPAAIEATLNDILDTMAQSKFWTPQLEQQTVLYLPQSLSGMLKQKVSDLQPNYKIKNLILDYVSEIVLTPHLQNEAIVMIKNDDFGTLLVEHKKSPVTLLRQDTLKTEYYVGITLDAQVVPEPGQDKSLRVIDVTNIV